MPPKKLQVVRVADILSTVHRIAPPSLAESWDNVGLQMGDAQAPAGKVLVALEVTREVLAEAKRKRVSTIVTHHPLLFRPTKNLVESTATGSLSLQLIRQGHALIAAHTNLDSVASGTNGELADRLGLQTAGRTFLEPSKLTAEHLKYVVYVPSGPDHVQHTPAVIEAMARAGAGAIGKYSHCTFRTPGTGTYKALEGANPYIGEIGSVAETAEDRIECIVPKRRLAALLAAVRSVHPYEEIAYDVYPLEPAPEPRTGLGLIGNLAEPTTLGALAKLAKKMLGVTTVGIVGAEKTKIGRVAVCTGAGGSLISSWKPGTADVFVTGEMNHHGCAEAAHLGIPTLLVGHWASEVIVGERFAGMIRHELSEVGLSADVVASTEEKDPLRWV